MTVETVDRRPAATAGTPADPEDRLYQERILPRVSRTFALTIPELPEGLRDVVATGYLLCRIADSIEDEPGLDTATKRALHARFADVVDGKAAAGAFAADVAPLLSDRIGADERELVAGTARVVRLTRAYGEVQRDALARCVRIMCDGMPAFQDQRDRRGLADVRELHRYCYYVAGVVGEMLTELFVAHAPDIRAVGPELRARAVSFGQGLQMTNILKDIWDDLRRGFCWLPDDLFRGEGYDLEKLSPGEESEAMSRALGELIAIAHQHLRDALDYTLLIPRRHAGIRRFCLRALGMAVLTLRKINRNRDFTATGQVKISRRSVAAVIGLTDRLAGRDLPLRLAFGLCSSGLPVPRLSRVEWEGSPSR